MKQIAARLQRPSRLVIAAVLGLACSFEVVRAQEKQDAPATNTAPSTGAAQATTTDKTFTPPSQGISPADGGIGVGMILGEPTGLSVKGWLSDRTAVDAGAAWAFDNPSSFHLHGDFLFHNFDLLPVSKGKLPVYFGVGGRAKFEEHRDTRVGIRGPVGVAYLFEKVPVDIFVEIAPILDLAPKTKFGFNGGIGVRYYFR